MEPLRYEWNDDSGRHELRLVPVQGTRGTAYQFCQHPVAVPIEVADFHIMHTTVTQALWTHVMDSNPATRTGSRMPVENVSWDEITQPGGFLEKINAGRILRSVANGDRALKFRLPSETEWEYAARGGPNWRDSFAFSGSDDPDEVAWFGNRWSGGALKWNILKHLKAWGLADFQHRGEPPRTHEVALKKPNQLGLYDMSGNVWEWCQDTCVELDSVPRDGSPASEEGEEPESRRLRGGCNHNWDIHCTVWWRYGFPRADHGGAIGFRLVLA